ncbi:MAG TPA: lipoyl(octanoyl) transferase LipB [Pseudobdellovibrionaceae bacterium]|nr:lipoyl(octanoyl) transferase LipB [Pseudobdellovibrionaceae bacterium]
MSVEPSPLSFKDLEFEDWGLIDYEKAQEKQLALLEHVHETQGLGRVVFCTHPPLVTLGRQTLESDLCGWTGPIHQSSRGGRATYHGPSQIVIYPIINLHHPYSRNLKLEVVNFIRFLENLVIQTLDDYGIVALPHSNQSNQPSSHEESLNFKKNIETGVWVEHSKIASIGISVKKWITYHGIAINIDQDPEAFHGIKPCGYESSIMTNLESLLQRPIDHQEFKKRFTKKWTQIVFKE